MTDEQNLAVMRACRDAARRIEHEIAQPLLKAWFTSAMDHGVVPSLDAIRQWVSSPWTVPPTADAVVCDDAAFRSIAKHVDRSNSIMGGENLIFGMPVSIDDTLPLGTVRFVTRSGEVVKEFVIAADDLNRT